jgi:hypothetical protein
VTQLARRNVFWTLFIFGAANLAVALFFALTLNLGREAEAFLVENNAYHMFFLFGISIDSLLLSSVGVVASCLFATVTLLAILRTFRKTVSPEIFFFAIWVGILSFETLRPAILYFSMSGASDSILIAMTKIYMGMRIAGESAIFVSGLYAVGLRNDRHLSVVLLIFVISFALSSLIPVDSGVWTDTLILKMGYASLYEGLSIVIWLITMTNFTVAVRIRGERSYLSIALGFAAAAAGSHFLSLDMSPLVSLIAFATMASGTILFISRLHTYYLWQ